MILSTFERSFRTKNLEKHRAHTFFNNSVPRARMGSEPMGVGGGGYSHTLPIRVCAAQRDFEAPDLELA